LDVAKAYDLVDWQFFKSMLEEFGFAPTWVNWIMTCVTPVEFLVRSNGQLLEFFYTSRGLGQGDP
jgi:hypothetical protein